MSLALGLLCLCTSVDVALAKSEAVVFVVDPSWDCVASYVKNVPLLHEYKIIKVMTRLGQGDPCDDRPVVDIYQNITYDSWTPNDALSAEVICPNLQSMGFPIAAVIPTFDPAAYLADRIEAPQPSPASFRGSPAVPSKLSGRPRQGAGNGGAGWGRARLVGVGRIWLG